ncbi:hypothetical protein [Pararobbsia alpina]|uniref:Membrane protein 6-pyruvoyl-tetrahydropterin synthase-related domain-containing protein n=1 Tax=Pararobbsia alpina TaxID=621374 RepID=A0A6S7BH40_9BURK|nr:hypothetical protein [Pararobbsia alpina]CAB3800079.1 hypothetical protein LMG28138_04786 [Pararobbsia alpina]
MNTTSFHRQFALITITRRVLTLRALFIAIVLYGGILFWIAPRPPMVDIPQHAAQIATLHDMLLGESPWQRILAVNLFTPYLIGYGLALAFSFVMPVAAAIKLALMLSYYTFVFACVLLRRRFGGDARLDWLFVPSFFGLSYQWGFYTFILAVPLGLLYLLLALQHADRPSRSTGGWLLLAGVILFFAHGLIFLVANAIGAAFVLVRSRGRRLSEIALALIPYAGFALLSVAYVVLNDNAQSAYKMAIPGGQFIHRGAMLFMATWGAAFSHKWPTVLATLLTLATAHMLGLRLNRRSPAAFVPLVVLLAYWFLVPEVLMNTSIIYERFAVYVLPFYAFLFVRREDSDRDRDARRHRDLACQVALALICIAFFSLQTKRSLAFATESANFERVLAAAEPAQRALMLPMDPRSPAADNPVAYMHYAAWYQADKQGLVDFNFAEFLPQIVRYRERHTLREAPDRLSWMPGAFNWKNDRGADYRYFFVRESGSLPPALLTNRLCPLTLVEKSGSWSLYENRQCH